MSADNWSVCPKCYEESPLKTKDEKLAELYGTVSAEEFLKLQKTVTGDERRDDFREDYEFCLKNRLLYIGYHGECQKCGLRFDFQKIINILTNEEATEEDFENEERFNY